eukprot:1586399-Pyramimonas_sp.AAC.1
MSPLRSPAPAFSANRCATPSKLERSAADSVHASAARSWVLQRAWSSFVMAPSRSRIRLSLYCDAPGWRWILRKRTTAVKLRNNRKP